RRIDAGTNLISTVAGTGSAGYSGDGGAATAALLTSPNNIAFDASANFYISDTGNHVIRKINTTNGVISTFAGDGTPAFTGDGAAAGNASLDAPTDQAVDATGDVFIADFGNDAVRRVDGSSRIITTVAGNGTAGFSGNGGVSVNAVLNGPAALAFD